MDLDESREAAAIVLAVRGRVDAVTAPQLQERAAAWLDGGERSLLLDLGGVHFISSAGLRVVLMMAKRLRDVEGGRFAVCSLRGTVAEVFRISGFDSVMEIYADRTAALAQWA